MEVVLESTDSSEQEEDDNEFSNKLEEYYIQCTHAVKPPDISAQFLILSSKTFPVKFPVESIRCERVMQMPGVTQECMEYFINNAYPIIHESVIPLFINFLEYKKTYGSHEEKELYSEMGLCDLLQRLLMKRAVRFHDADDNYMLFSGMSGTGGWERIGRDDDRITFLNLKNCLSYDEMKLSAFISVSSYSYFINDGNRKNNGVLDPHLEKTTEERGVVVSLTGPRFEKPNFMDWQEVVVSKEQNNHSNGYGKSKSGDSEQLFMWRSIWADFYGVIPHLKCFEEITDFEKENGNRYAILTKGILFDNFVYRKRLQIMFETLLLEANFRASVENTTAYIHVVGVGLGIWMVSEHQEMLFLDSFAATLKDLLPVLSHVSDVNFAWFKENSCGGIGNNKTLSFNGTKNKIRILFSRRNPHALLPPEDSGKLLVVTYPGDSNALPGNEFWAGVLTSSGNASEAASSQIAEIHNPRINHMNIRGSNVRVATRAGKVAHIAEFAKMKLDQSSE